jgi:hypothetical protein
MAKLLDLTALAMDKFGNFMRGNVTSKKVR